MIRVLLLALLACAPVTVPASAKPLHLPVETATVAIDALTGRNVLNMTFAGAASRSLVAFSMRHMGRQIDVRIDGELITSPWIQGYSLGGTVTLTGDFSAQEFQRMADRLLSGQAMVELGRRRQP